MAKSSSRWIVAVVLMLGLCGMARAARYYVDYDGGDDSKPGNSAEAAFKHAPGDPQAASRAKAVALMPGDTVLLKGGVAYCGMIELARSGEADKPITFDGNSAGTFGTGRAIIDGSTPLTGWKRCASAEEAQGNVHWKDIFYVDIPKPGDWLNLNLCDGEKPLPVSQDPKPSDPFFQQNPEDYYQVSSDKISGTFPGKISFDPGTVGNPIAPLSGLLFGQPAVVQPITGGAFTIELDNPVTITAVAIQPQPKYPPVKEVAFYGDGKQLLKVTLAKDSKNLQKFDLPAPATVRKLTVKLLSAYEGTKENWTKIGAVAAYNADGKNVLEAKEVLTVIKDEKVLTETDPHYFDNIWVAIHGGNNLVYFQKARRFEPETHRLFVDNFAESLYKTTRYCFYNSVRLIDRPGEYSIESTPDPKIWRICLLPEKLQAGQPVNIGYSMRDQGLTLTGAAHVLVKGLLIRRQGKNGAATGILVKGGSDVTISDCDITLVNGTAGISVSNVDQLLIDKCYVHHCPGHTKGIVVYKGTHLSTRHCRLVKNSGTALDYYTCQHGNCLDNLVLDHRGMHSNGLTFYIGVKDLVIEGNEVHNSNIAFTIRDAENIVIRNNIFDGSYKGTCVGIWPNPLHNVQFLNNTIVRSITGDAWSASVFSNNPATDFSGLVFRNNIIDGLAGILPGTFQHNIYTRWGPLQKDHTLGPGEVYQPDLAKLFVDPEHGDFHFRAGSPAIAAGMDVGLKNDMTGAKLPPGKAPDIGAYPYRKLE